MSLSKRTDAEDRGIWELDLIEKKLHWSDFQYTLYGYQPGEIALNDDFFLIKTTHLSEVKRISEIIKEALNNTNSYNFKRRILKKDGSIGFVETKAKILRSSSGEAQKIVGTTFDLTGKKSDTVNYNDPEFFKTFYNNYKRTIKLEVFRMTYNHYTTEDLCQEIFTKAWQNMSKYDPSKGALYTWLINIAKNHCKDYLKSKHFKHLRLTESLNYEFTKNIKIASIESSTLNVKDLFLKLPACQREIMELVYIQGYTQTEVAELKKMPLGTIKTKSRTALNLLKEFVKQEELMDRL